MKIPIQFLIIFLVILLILPAPVDSLIRIPLTKSDPPPERAYTDAPSIPRQVETAVSLGESRVSTESDRKAEPLDYTYVPYRTGDQFIHFTTTQRVERSPLEITKWYGMTGSTVWVYVEIKCVNKTNSVIDIVEIIYGDHDIEEYTKCGILKGGSEGKNIDSLINYYIYREKTNTQNNTYLDFEFNFTKKRNDTLHVKIDKSLEINDKISYKYSFLNNGKDVHEAHTIVRFGSSFPCQDLESNLKFDTRPQFQVDLYINKYYALFGEEVPIVYGIKYIGGPSDTYKINEIEPKPCHIIKRDQDTYEYHIDGNKIDKVKYNNIQILYVGDNKNNTYYTENNLSLVFKAGKSSWYSPYQTEYVIPGIYIDDAYYKTNEKIIVSTMSYTYKDWILAFFGALITIFLAIYYNSKRHQKELRNTEEYIKKLVSNTDGIKNQIYAINQSVKRTTIYEPGDYQHDQKAPWWWEEL